MLRHSLLVVDDEPDIQSLVTEVLRMRQSDFDIVGLAGDGGEAIREWRRLRPDVVLLDHRMPDLSGIEVAQRMLFEEPAQCIVLFSAFITGELETEAQRVGVRGCVSKDRVFDLPDVLRQLCEEQAGASTLRPPPG